MRRLLFASHLDPFRTPSFDRSRLQLIDSDILPILPRHNRTSHLPNLNQIVLRRTANHPRIIPIPTEITDSIRMAAMHEQQFRRPIFTILGGLLLAHPAEIPEDDSSVVGAGAQD